MPKRIQMSRQHPWRAENPDAVIVARPSKWGNPFRVIPRNGRLVFEQVTDVGPFWLGTYPRSWRTEALTEAVERFEKFLNLGHIAISVDDVRAQLAGKDLACWCPLDQPCHADVLLEIANRAGA